MGGYTPLRPWSNGGAPGISAAFLTALEAVLSRPSGDTETGKYYLGGAGGVTNSLISMYIASISRSATPVSVTIDTADQAASNMVAPGTANVTSNGFQLFSNTNAVNTTNAHAAGNTTINF